MADQASSFNTSINSTSFRFEQFCASNPGHAGQTLHPAISEHDLTRLDHDRHFDNQIPDSCATNGEAETEQGKMQCCCGRPNCAYLEHNNEALGGLERNLETAARLGQALLDRHEAYVRESQVEQAKMSSQIANLEDEKTHLQYANHRIVVENRELLQKLEQLNFDFGENGKRVNELEDLLQDCEQEIRRLNGLTRKTQDLELRVLDMEKERADLAKVFEDGRSETRSTIARWRESERKVKALEQEMQKIEWSAKMDREKHEQIVARIERERVLERELALSEGRLKATAAVQTMQHGGPQKQVVSNFVRDILQDNANLQEGIAELRDLLQSSNDEVQNLREQIMLHQPISGSATPVPQRQVSLGEELEFSQSLPKQVEKEVHVHHHYHTKFGNKKPRTPIRKAPRRRAYPSSALSSSPSSGSSTPMMGPKRHMSTPASPLIINPPRSQNNRWSMQSTATNSTYMSSMASSPRSYFDRNSSIFDRLEREEETSRPTSPESFNLASPIPFKRTVFSDDSALSVFEEEPLDQEIDPTESLPLSEDTVSVQEAVTLTVPEPATAPAFVHDHPSIPQLPEQQPPELELTPKPSMLFQKSLPMQTTSSTEPELAPPEEPISVGAVVAEGETSQTVKVDAMPTDAPVPAQHERAKTPITIDTDFHAGIEIRPSIRRANSHDSLLSISGMDIHLAQHSRTPKSALNLLGTSTRLANKHHFAPTPASLRKPLTSATQPVAAITEFTATSRHGSDSPSASILALHGMQSSASAQNKGLIGTVGGWVSGKWGRAPAPMKSYADLRSTASSSPRPSVSAAHFPQTPAPKSSNASTFSASTSSTAKRSISANMEIPSRETKSPSLPGSITPGSFMGRPPGINQSGFIPGFAAAVAAKRTPTVLAPRVDADMLNESLAE